jgi:hypothetical protein
MPKLIRRIVTTTYGYKRPSRKKAKAGPLPALITATAKGGRQPSPEKAASGARTEIVGRHC